MRTIDQTSKETATAFVVNGRLQVDAVTSGGGGTQNVNVQNFPATQPVSGTVAVSNFPATQFVAPAATFPVTTTENALSNLVTGTIAVGATTFQSAIIDTGATISHTVFYVQIDSTAAPTTPVITMEQNSLNSATGMAPMLMKGSGTAQAYAVPATFPSGATGFCIICDGWLRYVRYTVTLGANATAAVNVRVYRQSP